MHDVDPSCVRHKRSRNARFRNAVSRKEPGHEVDGGDSHANAKENAGEDTFRTAFAEGEGESGNNDCDERKPACDSAGERLLENTHGVLPGRSAGGLSERRCGEAKTYEKCRPDPGGIAPATNCSPAYFHFEPSQKDLKCEKHTKEVHASDTCR